MDELDELRVKVAKVLGWRLYEPDKRDSRLFGTSPEGFFYREPPDWPRDMAAVMPLWDEMKQTGLVRLSNGDGDSVDFDYLACNATRLLTSVHNVCKPQGTPEAAVICLGWLEWKESQG